MKLKFSFHPTFFIFFIILLFTKNWNLVFSYFFVVILHEMGHYIVSNFLGYNLNKITLMPFGASLCGKDNFFKPSHEILIAVAGPLTNAILTIFCLALWWLFPSMYNYTDYFAICNISTLLFNLLPIYPLDGGRVLYAILSLKRNRKKSFKIVKIVGIIISLFLFAIFLVSVFIKINLSLGITSIFLLSSVFFQDEYAYYNFSYNFLTNDRAKILETNIITVTKNISLYEILKKINKNKFNMVNIIKKKKIIKTLTQYDLIELLEKNSLEDKIFDILIE